MATNEFKTKLIYLMILISYGILGFIFGHDNKSFTISIFLLQTASYNGGE